MINTEPQILNLPANPDPRPDQKPPGSEHRSRGKIGRLPRKIRDQLNQMIQDGVPYATIKQNLGDHGQQLTVDNLSEWKTHGGYKEWCNEQLWREEIGARIEVFTDLLEDTDPTALSLVGLKISLGQLCEQLRELGPGSRKEQFENDAAHYLRMVNSVARLAKSSLALQSHRDAAAKSQAAELKQLDQDRDLSDKEYELLVNNMDRVFKVRRRSPSAAPERSEGGPS